MVTTQELAKNPYIISIQSLNYMENTIVCLRKATDCLTHKKSGLDHNIGAGHFHCQHADPKEFLGF